MEFKSKVYGMSPEDLTEFYKNRDSLAKDRLTDLSQKSLEIALRHIDPQAETLLDAGCGNGYFLEYVHQKGIQGCGCDVFETVDLPHARYVKGNIECLPFEDDQFDIVASHHTLEHVIDIESAIAELKRVARNQIFVVVPCQRYYYYTLDEHIHFFPDKETLEHRMNMKHFHCEKVQGDLVFIGYK